jgi:hypothetical protein
LLVKVIPKTKIAERVNIFLPIYCDIIRLFTEGIIEREGRFFTIASNFELSGMFVMLLYNKKNNN